MGTRRRIEKYDIRRVLIYLGAEYVPPGRGGKAKMRCINPDHPDNRPSMVVDFSNNRARCFGCELSGDGIELVMRLEGVTFEAAIESCARATGQAQSAVRKEPDEGRGLFDSAFYSD